MRYLPIMLDLRGQRCLLAGGGDVALRKATLLLRAGAHVRAVAPDFLPRLEALLEGAEHELLRREASTQDLEGCRLLFAATDDASVNRDLAAAAEARGIPSNVADDPEHCRFVLPSIVDRSPLVVAISSSGSSPLLARRLRARLEKELPASYGRLAEWLGRQRGHVKAHLADFDARRRFWERLLDGPIPGLVLAGDEVRAGELLDAALEHSTTECRGEVWLVGAGPGDPDLLTLRALRLMQLAEVVLYDRLVSDEVLRLVRADAERIYVGKARDDHTLPQEEISARLVELARKGRRVLRLKGGDPFVFGRGGEEIAELAAAGIPFQIVPGITAATGCAAYAGIPLTHRDYAPSVRFLTAHRRDGRLDLPWEEMVRSPQTLVFYMGSAVVGEICDQLRAHGLAADTAAAVVEQGTMGTQRVLTGTLASLPARTSAEPPRPPSLIIVGNVVRLRGQLDWYRGDKT